MLRVQPAADESAHETPKMIALVTTVRAAADCHSSLTEVSAEPDADAATASPTRRDGPRREAEPARHRR